MKARPLHIVSAVAFLMLTIGAPAWAAKKPASKESLQKEATHVVTATVLEVSSTIEKSKIEKGAGNKDEIFSIKLNVREVAKGEDLKTGDEIVVVAWKAHKRIGTAIIGWQGHDPVPAKQDEATFYLIRKGKSYQPIMPNGIVIKDKKDE